MKKFVEKHLEIILITIIITVGMTCISILGIVSNIDNIQTTQYGTQINFTNGEGYWIEK